MSYRKFHSDILKLYNENVIHNESDIRRDSREEYPERPNMDEIITDEEKKLAADLQSLVDVVQNMSDEQYQNWLHPIHGSKEQYIEMLKGKISKLLHAVI